MHDWYKCNRDVVDENTYPPWYLGLPFVAFSSPKLGLHFLPETDLVKQFYSMSRLDARPF